MLGITVEVFAALSLKLTAILGAAFLAHLVLRRASAATRHAVWAAAMLGILLLPAVQFIVPPVEVPIATPLSSQVSYAPSPLTDIPQAPAPLPWPSVLALIWFLGVTIVLARAMAGLWQLRRMLRSARPASSSLLETLRLRMNVSPAVRLVESELVNTPMTFGVFTPVVILPAGAQTWAHDRLEVVLAHELGHVKRGDWASQMMARLACALYWFHPLTWCAERLMRREREHACDDLVVHMGVQPVAYAEHLLDLVRTRSAPAWPAALPMAGMSDIEIRLRALLASGRRRGALSRRAAAIAAAASVCVLLPLAALRAPAQVNTAKLTGTVSDYSGGVVPGANVLLIGISSKAKEVTVSNEAGEFTFTGIPSGEYTIEVRMRGFEISRSKVTVEPSRTTRHDVKLNIGSITENIEVIGERPAKATAAVAASSPKRIRVGGNVQATKLLKQVKPAYPENAKAQGIEGDVLMEAVISKEGKLLNLRSLNTLVNPELVTAAMDAVRQWEYTPTLLNGEPVEVVTAIHVGFHLK